MVKYLPLFFVVFLIACKGDESHDLTEEEIDAYVASCLDTNKVYDITLGLRYSKGPETYQVTEYGMADTAVLHNSQEITEFTTVMINQFYKDDSPVYLEEFRYEYSPEKMELRERKIYLNGSDVIAAYERKGPTEEEVDSMKFEKAEIDLGDYDLKRPRRAIDQEAEFEMKFGEFLIINPDSYLILENDENGYGVALFIMEGDMLLDEMYEKPESYKGKTIEVFHEFMVMNGIERMIYRGGIVKEN
jgi:hypothetical protein